MNIAKILKDLSVDELIALRKAISSKIIETDRCKLKIQLVTHNSMYNRWGYMHKVCYAKNNHMYLTRGAKGVVMCEEWRWDAQAFFDWCLSKGFTQKDFDEQLVRHTVKRGAMVFGPETCDVRYKIPDRSRR